MHIMHNLKKTKFNVKSVTVIVFVLYGSDGIFIFNAFNLWRSNIYGHGSSGLVTHWKIMIKRTENKEIENTKMFNVIIVLFLLYTKCTSI